MRKELGFYDSRMRQAVPWRRVLNRPHPRERLRSAEDRAAHASPRRRYEQLGAHPTVRDGVVGTDFAVWAPNAHSVSVLTDGNGWSPGQNVLLPSDSGIWTGFVPGAGPGTAYKYGLASNHAGYLEKSDPYAFAAEVPPRTASIVADVDSFVWNDGAWMERRAVTDWLQQPISVYEVHLSSWRRPHDSREHHSYAELAEMLIDYCAEMGFTHIQLMPICEHPFEGSWGYQVTGYFSPTSRFGDPQDFMEFVDQCHQAGLGVLIDWVPAHFPSDAHALARFDGTCLYEHSDPRQGRHPDWDTLIFNYGRTEVHEFLLSSATFWFDKYHVDGLRVDAVASMLYLDYSRNDGEWVPNQHGGNENLEAVQFLRDMNTALHGDFPGVLTIAEESTAWGGVTRPVHEGGLGFSLKWDMGWMNDTLRYMRREPIHRSHHQNDLSFRMMYAYTENFMLPLSHDEVVHGKRSLLSQMPGDDWQKLANLRALYGYQFAMPGKNLLFMGGELGQWSEWNHQSEIEWGLIAHAPHSGLQRFVADLNGVYRSCPALHRGDFDPAGFRWIQCDDWQNSVFAFVRQHASEAVVVAVNFTPVPRYEYRLGVPVGGCYSEILNSDAGIYGGGNIGNQGAAKTQPVASHDFEQSLEVALPPLAVTMFRITNAD